MYMGLRMDLVFLVVIHSVYGVGIIITNVQDVDTIMDYQVVLALYV
jgi:hypothetical protein